MLILCIIYNQPDGKMHEADLKMECQRIVSQGSDVVARYIYDTANRIRMVN